jgi:putative transposase
LSTVGHTGTWILDPNACGELTATDVEVIRHRQVDSANQESLRL